MPRFPVDTPFYLLLLLLAFQVGAAQRVIHPFLGQEQATRYHDLLEILDVALYKTIADFGDYDLVASSTDMTESRLIQEVRLGRRIDIIWSSTSPDKEKALRPIRIPLRKGILGYRICLIHKNSQYRINYVESLEDLKKLRVGQGIGWGDVKLYQYLDIIFEQAPYQSLFMMANSNRIDLFPRGINEIFKEYAEYGPDNPNIVIEKNLALYYPWPYYFFTSQQNETLAQRIETGLWKMIEDGSFQEIFIKHNEDAIAQANLSERRLIRVENPFLPAETPLENPELWFDPIEDRIK